MQQLFRENLDVDLQLWKKKNLTTRQVIEFGQQVQRARPDVARLVLIYNGSVLLPFNNGTRLDQCDAPCNPQLPLLLRALQRAAVALPLPNVLLVVVVGDNDAQLCHSARCQAPLFNTGSKVWAAGKGERNLDILVPPLQFSDTPLYVLPWDKKNSTAFWRGSVSCGTSSSGQRFTRCARTYLSRLSTNDTLRQQYGLDIGVTTDASDADKKLDAEVFKAGPLPKVARVDNRDYARHKYLLDLDGPAASGRLARLMRVNSVVLRQRSQFIEYFTRSLKPDVHYYEFWSERRDDVLSLLERLRRTDKTEPKQLVEVVRSSLSFAARFTSSGPRTLYWRAALRGYRALLPDMDEQVERLVAELKGKGLWHDVRHPRDGDWWLEALSPAAIEAATGGTGSAATSSAARSKRRRQRAKAWSHASGDPVVFDDEDEDI